MFSATEGYVAFSNILTEDQYQGQDVGYNVTLCMDQDEATKLADSEVVVKSYKSVAQRKFKSGYNIGVLTEDGQEMQLSEELPRGAKVRVQWKHGPKHPQHGVSTYVNKIKVLDMGNGDIPLAFEESEENKDF